MQKQSAIVAFLKERRLELSSEKTKITHKEEGFDFLGQNLRKYKGTLLIKPSKASIKKFLSSIRETIKSNRTAKTENLIFLLNPKIRGWANYHRHVGSKRTLTYVDHQITWALWRWAKRRHPNKGKRWVKRKYFPKTGTRQWSFSSPTIGTKGKQSRIQLFSAADLAISRHIKIIGEANPYDPKYREHFFDRQSRRRVATAATL